MKEKEVAISMSKLGCPHDNAISENRFILLKWENIDDYYKDIGKLHADVNKKAKWYDNVLMHSALEYQAPKQIRGGLEAILVLCSFVTNKYLTFQTL